MTPRATTIQQVLAEVRALATPLLSFWGATLVGITLFTLLIVVTNGGEVVMNTILLTSMWTATFGGIFAGQVCALLRLRSVWVVGLAMTVWTGMLFAGLGGAITSGMAPLGIWIVVFLFLVPLFFACGYWSLTTNMGLLALFAPLVWFIGTILVIAEKSGGSSAWEAGDKWQVWNVFNAAVLGVGILLCVLYLASREMHRLHRWRFAPVAAEMSASPPEKGMRRGGEAIGCSGLVVLLLLGVMLTGTTALVAPFLWRTGPDDGDGNGNGTTQNDPQPVQPQPGNGQGDPQPGDGPLQQAQRAAQEAAAAMVNLLIILLLALAAIIVFGPPLRRTLLLRHLRRPLWPVPPTRRVAQHWRLVEIALGDLGEPRLPGDSARALVDRAVARASFIDPESLHRCADVADRVQYGLGLRPDDAMMARRTAEMTYQTVWDELGEWQKIRAMYRWL